MRIVVAGSSGLIGTPLVASLRRAGHDVVRLVRRPARDADEITWDPAAGTIDGDLEGVGAAANLAGAGVGDKRWTKAYKAEIRDSRVGSTITLSRALARLQVQPAVLVNGSAIGYYGSRGDERLTEDSAPGQGFLAEVVQDWEAATAPASQAGIRVVHARTGLVVSDSGGAFGRLLPIFKYGLGGRVGSGSQYWSFISLRDELGILLPTHPKWHEVRRHLPRIEQIQRRMAEIPQELVWEDTFRNLVTTEGKNAILTHFLKGSSYTASQVLGLIEDTGYSAISATNTAANITAAGGGSPTNGWNEAPSATFATRGTPSFGTAGSGSLATSSAVSCSIIATDTIKGAFLMCRSAAGTAPTTTVGNTNGALYSAGLFTGGDRAVANGDTLNVSYTASL